MADGEILTEPRLRSALGVLETPVRARLKRLREDRVVERLWRRDHTLWKHDPTEITDRLGWLTVAGEMLSEFDALRRFASDLSAEGYETAVILGMGGSSLAPEVLFATFGRAPGGLELIVLDATDPAQVADVEARIALEHTLFVVASKSGSTVETLSHLAYFWDRIPEGAHFIAITDPRSGLEKLARDRGFRRVFLNPEDIGGRYSALSYFGLVPAALIGADIEGLVARAEAMRIACEREDPEANPGALLGAVIGEAALAGRDQLTLVLPPEIGTLGYWIEQLVAESTGKEGKGILPIEGEPLGLPEVYGPRRLFVAIGEHAGLDALEAAGHPVVRLPYGDRAQLGAEFFRWEFATAVAGHVLEVNPFDQPNVQEAKDATNRILAGGEASPEAAPLEQVLATLTPQDYLAILAYVSRNAEVDALLQHVRVILRDRYHVATTVGYGPRFLHSTGQLHKGGPANGVFIQVVGEDPRDLAIPGRSFSFSQLKHAQALGDLDSLRAHGRRAARATLEELDALASRAR